MRGRCNRAILFAKVNEDMADLLSLLTVSPHMLALEDAQIRCVEDNLVVHSLEEFEDKFKIEIPVYEETQYQKAEQSLENVERYYKVLEQKERGEQYRLWYYDIKEKEDIPREHQQISVKQYEIWLGVKSFFEQGENLELLISNLSYEDMETNDAERKLSLYMETVNEKLDDTQQITFAVFTEIPMMSVQTKINRIRFEGTKKKQDTSLTDTGKLAFLFNILEREQIVSCYQYETGVESSARAVALEGRTRIQESAFEFEKQINSAAISCCYPNLTWIEDQVYIGAAYVVAGMLLAGREEKSMTTIPRELYPYREAVKEELAKTPFGSMLSYSPKAGDSQMLLDSARCQEWRFGSYRRIDREDVHV